MPRVIHIIPFNYSTEQARYSLEACSAMAGLGWSVTAYTCNAMAVDAPFRSRGIDLRQAPLHGFYDPATASLLTRHLRREPHGTVVHTHRYRDAFCVLLARRIARRPDIRVVTSRLFARPARRSLLYTAIYRGVAAHLFSSAAARAVFLSAWPRGSAPFDTGVTRVVPQSVITGAEPAPPEPEKGPMAVCYAADPRPGCGVKTLIDAMTRLRGHRIRLFLPADTEPDYADSLRRHAIYIGVADLIDWRPPRPDMSAPAAAHMAVVPDGDVIAPPAAELEAMAAGRPVITPGRASAPGRIAPPAHDPDALAAEILRLAADPELRRTTGAAARAAFDTGHSWSRFASGLSDIYLNL